ncbi:MAG: CDP-alcohol phosphatidyltransferase family protein [Pseudorhodobacter sp.]
MFDAHLLPYLHRMLGPPAGALARRGITADQVTLAGFGIGGLALPALWAGLFLPALLLILVNRLADGLDGALARLHGPTDRGAFLDIALDFLFYALVPLGFVLADPAVNAVAGAVLIASFIGTGSSFLAFAIIAERRGLMSSDFPKKGLYYLGGLTEGTETIAFFVLICLFPSYFPVLALIFAAACFVTTGLRWSQGWHAFS